MKVLTVFATLSCCLRYAVGARIGSHGSVALRAANDDRSSSETEGGPYCCCKKAKCEAMAKDDTGNYAAVYAPDQNLCCKLKKWRCGHAFAFSAYDIKAPNSTFCISEDSSSGPKQEHFAAAVEEDAELPVDLKPGMPAHTIHNYCNLNNHQMDPEDDEEAVEEQSRSSQGAVINALVTELSKNSLDTMAKEIFSIYVCVRWAPNTEFMEIADGEIKAEQLPNSSSGTQHYKDFRFIPMRCSKNFNVYGKNPDLGDTHFNVFEKEMQSIIKWYDHEKEGALNKRLKRVHRNRVKEADLKSDAELFDMSKVRRAVRKCKGNTDPMLVDTFNASTRALLGDCAAAKWWLGKLQDWHRAMPFVSFMSPDRNSAQKAAPHADEQMLVCFGKRVASQLHRRDVGTHLLTDQSAVGCHGFWELKAGVKMLERIVQLWRPPTCQLAAMELDMKIKLTELIASMNTNLFDALPALLVDEMSDKEWDGKSLQAASGLGVLGGVFKSIASSFSNMKGSYVRLGELLGNTVVKWAVCPLKPITDPEKIANLDAALGTEDDLLQSYAKTAYSKWTGAEDLLPGEACEAGNSTQQNLPRTLQCTLGLMRESMPEPYKDEEFICPIRPLLPAKQQLEIFKKKTGQCLMRMTAEQMTEKNWFYRGRNPQRKQYDLVEHLPTDQYRCDDIVSMSTLPDSEFHIWRTFVTVARGCTEEEANLTPRWCAAPEIGNAKSIAKALLGGAKGIGSGLGYAAGKGLEAAGLKNKTMANEARTERLGQWFKGRVKGFEKWVRETGDEFLGKASRRYDRLEKHLFDEVEAAELLHSASFQASMTKTGGDSKNLQKFDRFAVVCPCQEQDARTGFDLKFEWAENALELARKGYAKFGKKNLLDKAGAFTVQLRGAASLHVRNEKNAWLKYSTHVRATLAGATPAPWIKTDNPFLTSMAGALEGDTDDLRGFTATFACGSRVEMHDMARELPLSMERSFLDCLTQGVEKNAEVRAANPTKQFHADEIVVRVTFKPFEECHHNVDWSKAKEAAAEQENPKAKSFARISGCQDIQSRGLPRDVVELREESTYRGLHLGKGLPEDTLMEVLLDPADFIDELNL